MAFIASATYSEAWCGTEDRSAAVCIRNWVNAAGNLFTFVIAAIAAAIAYGASHREVNLPRLESHREVIIKLAKLYAQIETTSEAVNANLVLVQEALREDKKLLAVIAVKKVTDLMFELERDVGGLEEYSDKLLFSSDAQLQFEKVQLFGRIVTSSSGTINKINSLLTTVRGQEWSHEDQDQIGFLAWYMSRSIGQIDHFIEDSGRFSKLVQESHRKSIELVDDYRRQIDRLSRGVFL
ncbi:hypothetical protein JKG68_02860 [Microvirga aerilata]|uniref:Uncharacterized protein n=1 Tax=Microvirga aerilata TaxID=670292 RepID=A0A937D0D2_9HYPH|nr:hypothetical protein [Microvirga aerilata]MBL0402900.1 hypothetical protein [Microvirga aerilata]